MIKSSITGWHPPGVVCFFQVGGGTTRSSERFSRQGRTVHSKHYQLPGDLSTAVQQSYRASGLPSSLVKARRTGLAQLIGQDPRSFTGRQQLVELMNLTPSGFEGRSALFNIVQRDPYSRNYEEATAELFNRTLGQARAAAASGPHNVRGAVARRGFELADLDTQAALNRFKEINAQQGREAELVANAVQIFNTIEAMRRGTITEAQRQAMAAESQGRQEQLAAMDSVEKQMVSNLANLQLAAELLGVPTQVGTEDISGAGQASGSSVNASLGCCFIFLECLNGKLPWYVRWGRECYRTENRIRGYRWMSKWLVPLMQRWGFVKHLVNSICVKPFLAWGKAQYVESKRTPVLKAYCWCWFHLWSFIGYLRKGKNEPS